MFAQFFYVSWLEFFGVYQDLKICVCFGCSNIIHRKPVATLALARNQGKGVARVRAKRKPGSHIKTPGSARKCEGVGPHTPKATPMLGVGESWSPKRTPETSERVLRGQDSMAWCALYINGKLLKRRCLKWARIAHLDI
jgi:hypothetical protein